MSGPTSGGPTTIGVLGGAWRADVDERGAIEPWDGSGRLDWFVAADDRWHVPATEPAVRQVAIESTPVLETRVRIPGGDAVQRVFAIADNGGMTVIEIENESSLPIAVAFSRADLLSVRPPVDVPAWAGEVPPGAVSFPVGHRAVVTVALAHGAADRLPENRTTALQVARGWLAMCDRASRLVAPDGALVGGVVAARCRLALEGPADPHEHPAEFLRGVAELVRMGERADPWAADVAEAVHRMARGEDAPAEGWSAAAAVLRAAGETKALRDLARVRSAARVAAPASIDPGTGGTPVDTIHRAERIFVHDGQLLPGGVPAAWLGQPIEAHGIPCGDDGSTVSFALRWHGTRPAVLWEVTGPPVRLTSPVMAPGWTTNSAAGDALWPEPPGAAASAAAAAAGDVASGGGDVSFS